jgi:hypothetical protein
MLSKILKRFREREPELVEEPDDPPTAQVDPRVADMQRNRVRGREKKIVGSGFDPYNSGAFDRSGTWERVPRK